MTMNKSLLSHLLDENLKLFSITFDSQSYSKKYVYKSNIELNSGDLVLVPCPSIKADFSLGSNTEGVPEYGLALGKVYNSVEPDFESSIEYKWIFDKVDPTNYEKLVKQDSELVDQVRNIEAKIRKQQLKQALFSELGEEQSNLLLANYSFDKTTTPTKDSSND